MRRLALILGCCGVLLVAGLIVDFGPAEIGGCLAAVGWGGLLAVTAYRLLPMSLCAVAWWLLLPGHSAAGLPVAMSARLGRDGVAALAPVMPGGGEIVGARILALRSVPPAAAAAATIGDVTAETLSQVAFTLIGIAELSLGLKIGGGQNWLWYSLAASVPLAGGLVLVQHPVVLGWVERLIVRLASGRSWADWLGEANLSAALAELYRRRRSLTASIAVHLLAWLVGIGETWIVLRTMGRPLALPAVLGLESVVFALRSAAFMMPFAAGVQEGGYLALGAALGLAPETALTLSLVRRVPDVVIGLPGLMLWHGFERKTRAGKRPAGRRSLVELPAAAPDR